MSCKSVLTVVCYNELFLPTWFRPVLVDWRDRAQGQKLQVNSVIREIPGDIDRCRRVSADHFRQSEISEAQQLQHSQAAEWTRPTNLKLSQGN